MKLEVSFDDLNYEKKRKKYRSYAYKNSFTYEIKLFIIDEIAQDYPKEILPGLNTEYFLDSLLTDGYVAYKRVFDIKQEKIISYDAVDPTTLIVGNSSDNKKIWYQYKGYTDMERILHDEEILYVIYPIIGANDSLVGQIYTKQIELMKNDILNDFMISYIVKKVKIQLDEILEQEMNFFDKK